MKNNKKGSLFASVAIAVFVAAFFYPKITKAFEDSTAPEITSLDITPIVINTTEQNQTLTINIGVRDSGVGICPTGSNNGCDTSLNNSSYLNVKLAALISTQSVQVYNTQFTRVSGDDNDGMYTATMTIPYGSKVGIWQVDGIMITDKINNQVQWNNIPQGPNSIVKPISSIPNASGLTIANTAESTSVRIEKEWTLSSSKASVTFPVDTTVTKNDGGSFAFYQMVNQEASIGDLTTDGLAGYAVGTIRFGIPGLNLSFSKPVTVALNVGSQYNGTTLTIKSLSEGASSWANETTCKVSNSVCQFTTNHATYFTASSAKNLQGKLSLKVSVKKKVKKSSVKLTGKTGKYLTVTITVNGQLMTTLTANKKGKFGYLIPLQIGNNTVVVQASNGSGTKTITKVVQRK